MSLIKVLATGSKGNCYIIEIDNEKLILECGINWSDILKGLNYDLNNICGCLISHEHKDHALAINEVIANAIRVYAPQNTLIKNNLKNNRKATSIKDKDLIKIGNFLILAFENNHTNNDGSKCECLGYLIYHTKIGKILFSTDTYYIKYNFKNLNYILIECNYSEKIIGDLEPYQKRLFKSHMSLETLKVYFNNIFKNFNNVKDIILIHLSQNNADPENFKREIEKLTGIPTHIAIKGLEI